MMVERVIEGFRLEFRSFAIKGPIEILPRNIAAKERVQRARAIGALLSLEV